MQRSVGRNIYPYDPMTLLKRLGVDCREKSVTIVHQHREVRPHKFEQALETLHPILYKTGGGIVWLSPTRLEAGSGYDYVAVGNDADESARLCQEVCRLLD